MLLFYTLNADICIIFPFINSETLYCYEFDSVTVLTLNLNLICV
jgi:hypothetical protein